ncbi:MAG: hypothetical protein AB8I08_30580 [Sandaracinaceae bacterium]
MTRPRLALWLLILAACGPPELEPSPRPAAPEREPAAESTTDAPPEPPPPPAPPECPLEDVPLDFRSASETSTLALTLHDSGGALAIGDGEAVRFVPLAADGTASGTAVPVPLRGSLLALEAVGDDANPYVIVTRGPCAESAHCLTARRVNEAAPEATVSAPLPAALVTTRRAVADSRLHLAWSAEGGERGLETFVVAPALGRIRRALGPEPADAELPVEILGLAAEGERFAVLTRRGAGEDRRSRVTLTSNDHHAELEALEEVLVVEAMEFDGANVALVAGFEMSRPHLLELEPGQEEPRHASEIAVGDVPDRFADRVRAALLQDEDGLHLRRRDAAGDVIGERVTVVEGRVRVGTVARRGEAFLVAWLDGEGELGARWVRCETGD